MCGDCWRAESELSNCGKMRQALGKAFELLWYSRWVLMKVYIVIRHERREITFGTKEVIPMIVYMGCVVKTSWFSVIGR